MDGSMDRLGGEEFTHPLEDSLGKGRGKLVRGDIDLEAMQDAFLRGSQKPAARVMRSSWSCRVKPSTVEISSSSARSSPFSVHLPNGHPSISCAVVEAPEGTVGQLPHPPEIPDFPSGIVGGIVERQPVGPQPMKVLMPKGLKGTSVRNRGQHVSEGWSGPAASAGKMRLDAPSVLSDVTERELPSSISGSFPPTDGLTSVGQGHLQTRVARGGFPEVVHRSKLKLMRLGKKKDVNVGQSVDHRGLFPLASDGIDSISKSCDSSFKDMDCVHAENTARVLAMSLPQVEEAQQEIRSMLSPAAIAALQNRGKVKAMAGMRHRDAHMLGNDDGSGDFRKDTAMDISAMDKAQFPTMPARVVERTGGGASKEGNEWGAGGEDQGDAPTISQTVATAVGGIGDKTTLEAALQTLPGGEQAKLAWTGRGDVRVETGRGTATELKSKLGTEEEVGTPTEPEGPRVDLRGEVVPEGAEVSSYEALYHHGEAPDRAGYTLTELVQLARSTVVGQRQVALRALAGVIRKRAKCISCNNKVDHAHLPEMLPLAIRMSLDEASASIVVCALDALEAWIIPLAQQVEEETFGRQGLCWVDHQVMPTPKVRPLSTPEEERCLPNPDSPNNTGGEEDEEMEMNNLAELCRNDPCQGMLKTALLTTLQRILNRYTLSRSILSRSIPLSGSGRQAPAVVGVSTEEGDSGGGGWGENIRARALPPQAALSCLKVLWAMARRSSDMAWNIVSEPGLLDSVREVRDWRVCKAGDCVEMALQPLLPSK